MRIPDLVAAAAIAGLGAFLVREGVDLGLGEPTEPGSGFMFWWIGVAMIVAGAALGITGLFAPTGRAGTEAAGGSGPVAMPLICIAALIGYALLLQPLGFIPTSAALLTGLFAFVGGYRLPLSLGMGTVSALACWFVFARMLSSNLPAGILAGTIFGS
ncbi:MAG: Uncharacterized protein FD152_4695 [Xanthobacteraceae bacterium]|nr:MAG: Uncharacterized protein FD152_4695 [Xanthobacteraceae bacterium]